MPACSVPVCYPHSEMSSHRASRRSLTTTPCPVLQVTAGSERARGPRGVTRGGGAATWPAGPWRPVTPVPISPSPALWAMHFPGPPSSVQPAVIRRPVAQVLTPSLGLSPPCRGQRENSGQSVCASSFLGRPLGSPGQVRRLGPQHSACKTAGKAVSGGRLSGCAWPRPGLGTKCLMSWETLSPGQTGVVGRPKPTHPAPPFT